MGPGGRHRNGHSCASPKKATDFQGMFPSQALPLVSPTPYKVLPKCSVAVFFIRSPRLGTPDLGWIPLGMGNPLQNFSPDRRSF